MRKLTVLFISLALMLAACNGTKTPTPTPTESPLPTPSPEPTGTATPASPLPTPTSSSPLPTPAIAFELLCDECRHVVTSGPVAQFVDVEVRQGNVIVYAETIDTGLTGLDAPCIGIDGVFTLTVPAGITGTAWLRPYWHGENISMTVAGVVVPWQDVPMRVEGQEPDERGFYLWGELIETESSVASTWAQGVATVAGFWLCFVLICGALHLIHKYGLHRE